MELDKSYLDFIAEIKNQIKSAQYRALQKVNKEQIGLYWNIGKTIIERQKEFGWGKGIVEILAQELQKELIGIHGFSARNLWRMRVLVEQYQDSSLILPPLVAEIPWTHNIIIIEKCKDENERFYYINLTRDNSWSKTMLINAIDAKSYERTVISQTNFARTLPADSANEASMLIKDEYLFDFLNLTEPYTEAQLEEAILSNIRNFLVELRGDFAGKMNFYLTSLNRLVKKEHEQPSIGIIICKSKNRTVVEFALQDINKPIGIATYSLFENLPLSIQQFFPSNAEFVERVESITKYIQEKAK